MATPAFVQGLELTQLFHPYESMGKTVRSHLLHDVELSWAQVGDSVL